MTSGNYGQPGQVAEAAGTSEGAEPRPNVILVVADDLRVDDLPAMPAVQELLSNQGMVFEQCFTPTPGCAPARASILRGQYPHNHGVVRGSGKWGGFRRFREMGNEPSTIATWLQDAGYHTGLVGKYLNAYPEGAEPNHIPPGWCEWTGATKGGYHGFELNLDGELVRYKKRLRDYQTDVLAEKTIDFVSRAAERSQPFFLYLAPRAPHGPATPADRHEGCFADDLAPRPPSFDAEAVNKPRWLQLAPALDQEQTETIDATYRGRLGSLQALDELIAALVETLEEKGVLERTMIVFTSDHGYHLGEHRIVGGKGTPYEEAIRVPLIIRGPGVPAGQTTALASTIDLAPTIAGWAGAEAPAFVDGRSLAPLITCEAEAAPWRSAVLVQHHHNRAERVDGPPAFQAMRTDGQIYVEYADGWQEVYDLRADPHELDNRAATMAPETLQGMAATLAELSSCAGRRCRDVEDAA